MSKAHTYHYTFEDPSLIPDCDASVETGIKFVSFLLTQLEEQNTQPRPSRKQHCFFDLTLVSSNVVVLKLHQERSMIFEDLAPFLSRFSDDPNTAFSGITHQQIDHILAQKDTKWIYLVRQTDLRRQHALFRMLMMTHSKESQGGTPTPNPC